MKEQEIIEGNRLIAEFMKRDGAFDTRDKIYHYDSSWDWLMTVIDKIHDIDEGLCTKRNYHVIISKRSVEIIYNWNNYTKPIIDDLSPHLESSKEYRYIFFNSKIEAVWTAIVEFIKWYNSCQKEK